MQDKIRSKYSELELLGLSAENAVYKCFELIGVYDEYRHIIGEKNSFENYYLRCIEQKRFEYRNQGVRIIYMLLDDEYVGYRGETYHISKRSMRKYGKTYIGEPIVVYEGSYIVLDKVIRYLKNNSTLWGVYLNNIHKTNLQEYLEFQKTCLDNYIKAGRSVRQRYYADEVREKINELISKIEV